MNRSLVWVILVLLISCESTSAIDKKEIIRHFDENWSYDWERADDAVSQELINKCKSTYREYIITSKEIGGSDKIIIERVYRAHLNSQSYLLIQFDFEVGNDGRVVFVYEEDKKEIIGHFSRSLA